MTGNMGGGVNKARLPVALLATVISQSGADGLAILLQVLWSRCQAGGRGEGGRPW
jgi:hypothetical protein